MSCNSCAKGYSFLRPEKGCPGCGFSYCSKCLNNKVYVPKIQAEAKVCAKCKRTYESQKTDEKKIIPPDAYYKRIGASSDPSSSKDTCVDEQIQARLKKLKEKQTAKLATEDELAKRLQAIKGEMPSTSDAELRSRLAKLKGMPDIDRNIKPVLPAKDLRTEKEQADELMKQYLEQTQIDSKYKDEFDTLVNDIESRVQRLKGTPGHEQGLRSTAGNEQGPTAGKMTAGIDANVPTVESDDEEEAVRKIVEKIKSEASIPDDELSITENEELPFCEICNEDATMRCLGCKYLFCRQCFLDHKDDDDGCNRYEPYKPPKGSHY